RRVPCFHGGQCVLSRHLTNRGGGVGPGESPRQRHESWTLLDDPLSVVRSQLLGRIVQWFKRKWGLIPGIRNKNNPQMKMDHGLMTKVAILGGSGYTAVELIKILLRHPALQLEAVVSRQEGTPLVAELHPSLAGRIKLRCEPFNADALVARGVGCVFGCLPH